MQCLWQAEAEKFRKQSGTSNVALQYLEITTILDPCYSMRAIHFLCAAQVLPPPEAFLSELSSGQGPVDGDKVDLDTSSYLSVSLKLKIMFIFPCFHFLNYAPLFSGLHMDPITQEEQKCLRRNPDKAQANTFSFTLKKKDALLWQSLAAVKRGLWLALSVIYAKRCC